jgi:hypothetical protein
MLDTDTLELDTIQEQGNIVIDTANKILLHRLDTTPNYPEYEKYRENLQETIERVNSPRPIIEGILFESLFYLCCKEKLNLGITISEGLEDTRGIDFHLHSSSKSFPIDVTLSKEKYPMKMRDFDKYTILLPDRDEYYTKIHRGNKIDPEIYLRDVFYTNMIIMANKNSQFQINKLKRKHSKKGYITVNETKTLSRYRSLTKPDWKDNKHKVITIPYRRYEEMLSILSIFKNLNP